MSLPIRFLSAIAWGCGMALIGVAIQHDANHGAMSNNKHVCTIFGATLDYLAGSSSYMWRQQHDYGHHSYTNIHDKDPDIRVTDTDIRRVTKWQPRHTWHGSQHVYLPILYSLLALKSVFVDDFVALYCSILCPTSPSTVLPVHACFVLLTPPPPPLSLLPSTATGAESET
jgi:linoleoyl-CoA desaturase